MRGRSSADWLERLDAACARAASGEASAMRELLALRALASKDAGEPSKPSSDDLTRARASYLNTHWGRDGSGVRQFVPARCADPRSGPFVILGELWSVSYLTKKEGDSAETIYEHEFDRPKPSLVYADDGTGLLAIAGGQYRVNWRGIVR